MNAVMKNVLMFAGSVAALCLVAGCRTGSSGSNLPMSALSPAPANAPIPTTGLAARIIEARRINDALLKHYCWSSRVELIDNEIDNEKIQDIRIDLVSLGPAGQWQRSVVNDQPGTLPSGFIRRRVAGAERDKVEQYVVGLRQLLDRYTQSSAGQVINFVSQAQISAPDANGLLELSGGSVLVPGDAFSLWIEPATRQTRRIQVTTTYEQDMVELNATFQTLKSGLTHVQYAEVNVPGKNLRLQMHNYDYNQNN
jgi:hypothetical protein